MDSLSGFVGIFWNGKYLSRIEFTEADLEDDDPFGVVRRVVGKIKSKDSTPNSDSPCVEAKSRSRSVDIWMYLRKFWSGLCRDRLGNAML